MERWEYLHYDVNKRGYVNIKLAHEEFKRLFEDSAYLSITDEKRHVELRNIARYEDLMKFLGKKGWELVCVVESEYGDKELFFKRKLEGAK
jgi:hypothetical protein